jgi:hypothetical protein
MVILGKKFGRLANRLWIFSYFAANAIEYDYKLLYRNFDEYIRYFPSCHTNNFEGHKIRARITKFVPLDYLLYWGFQLFIEFINKFDIQFGRIKIIRIKMGNIFDLKQKDYLHSAHNGTVIIRNGGLHYQDWENLLKHADKIRRFFQPELKYCQNVDALMKNNRISDSVLIGVHMRKSDYKRFLGGTMFFSDEIYLRNMLLIGEELRRKSLNVQFLICSDEAIDPKIFQGTKFFKGSGHFIEDLYAFSQCDYIIGPPSTYTAWASFYGHVPTCFISPTTKSIDVDNFRIINDINIFYDYIPTYE